ncbi:MULTISPECIES: Rrf2 family transcriptional regulator [Clostridium]|uniref:Rrf2 family transcriptional regulator n=1 Tax=Clostridium cibarium TaxID=2762247 RepID=A0ABR8PQA8_9CLOT|nr:MULTISPECIES: Rrf2 family transcriptional regulator [Clostridium]MBD7910347.1 Rrf2 family transcriptional regulator [Clostridium cibarium]
MKISTKVEYGLVALIDIATNSSSGEVVTVISISERQGISKNYLEQILTPLRQAGIINGTKGAQGGYSLTTKPEYLKISTILNALDSNLINVVFDNSMKCDQNAINVIKNNLWDKLDESFNKLTDNITLADLVEEYKNGTLDSAMFYI